MNDRLNKTSIFSIVFLDIIDYSKKSDSEQIDVKIQFNDLISRSLKSVAQTDRIILDTGDGVAIALMGSPEDAMFVALTIRDGILNSNVNNPTALYVRFGINLGPVRIVSDINGQPNIIGDGINVAQRIMSFAQANQILVSRSYYEVTSRLTLEFSEMFDYSGIKHDKHVREHEVYSVRSNKGDSNSLSEPFMSKGSTQALKPSELPSKINWKYAVSGLLVLGALLGFAKLVSQTAPTTPTVVFKQAENATNLPNSNNSIKTKLIPSAKIETLAIAKPVALITQANAITDLSAQQAINKDQSIQEKPVKTKLSEKKVKPKVIKEKTDNSAIAETVATRAEPLKSAQSESKPTAQLKKPVQLTVTTKSKNKEKSGFEIFSDSIKQGQKTACTQAQISMNQCH